MANNFKSSGDVITWTNSTGSAVESGQVVVIGKTMGVAAVDIANGASGSVYLEGVFTVPKVSGAVIAQGENIIWDASAGKFDDNLATPATGDVSNCVIACEAAGNGVTTIRADFDRRIGTVATGS
jgi:predicted RecA/RadA family phage recombinase